MKSKEGCCNSSLEGFQIQAKKDFEIHSMKTFEIHALPRIFSWILEKFAKNLIKYSLTHSQKYLDSSRCLGFFTDTVWILGSHGQVIHVTRSE